MSWLVRSLVPGIMCAQEPTSWEKFDFTHSRVDSAAIDHLSLLALRELRGIVFGKHGRPFTDELDVQRYLKSRPWYRPDPAFTNQRLSASERANIDVIRAAEARKHSQIETGDMRFYRDHVITTAMLGHHTAADWQLLAAEIGAAHGQTFMDDEPDEMDPEGHDQWVLQKYFDERYWYHRRPEYSPKVLSAIERANADTRRTGPHARPQARRRAGDDVPVPDDAAHRLAASWRLDLRASRSAQ